MQLRPDAEPNQLRAWMSVQVDGNQTRSVIASLLGEPAVVSLHDTNGRWDLLAELRAQGWNACSATDLEAAVGAADIVSCATLATQPVIEGRWLQPGTHLDLIGSFTPAMREADDACSPARRCMSIPTRPWPRAAICWDRWRAVCSAQAMSGAR